MPSCTSARGAASRRAMPGRTGPGGPAAAGSGSGWPIPAGSACQPPKSSASLYCRPSRPRTGNIPTANRRGNPMPAELLTRPAGGAPASCDLRGRIQADIVAGLPGQFRRMVMAPDQLHDWQRDRLRRLLASAIQRSAFHTRRPHGIDPPRFELADLPSLPVMTKAQMMDHFDDLISDRLLTREAAERALAATHDEPRPLPGGHMWLATGGSSGQRGIFACDPVSVAEFVSLIFRTRLAALGLASTDP